MMPRSVRLATLLVSVSALAGCMTMGGNIKGSFSCRAPDGICAPSGTIDDQALAIISGEEGDRMVTPAGPYPAERKDGRAYQTATATPARSRERVLRIVFPAQIDGAGRLHEQTAVHAVVERGDWQQADGARAVATTPAAVASAAATDGDTLIAALDRIEPAASDIAIIDPDMPTPEAIAAARTRATPRPVSSDPVGDIRDQVARRVATAPRRSPVPVTIAPRPIASAKPVTLSPPLPSASSPVLNSTAAINPSVPTQATAAGKAAIASVRDNATILSAAARVEADARSSSRTAATALPVLRAPSFPGLTGVQQ